MLVVTVLLRGMRSPVSEASTAELPGMPCWLVRGWGCRCLYSKFPPLHSYWLCRLDAELVLV